ncbi:hypothetical protein F5X99DRAFT_415056 [Biscogniauxia marginata]|nr:hypothetical protein F5X99DRAFT_415056 [Biscogniauxia marginata]
MRVPQLLGYVEHREARHIIGLLRVWVPGDLLRNIAIAVTAAERKQKWASQIREAVDQLHQVGVVWGDGKASNVIIDEKDDAWLIDFGGSYTEGWGDEQAVKKLIKFMNIEEADF